MEEENKNNEENVPPEVRRKNSVIDDRKNELMHLNDHLQTYYDKNVVKSLERKTKIEDFAYNITHKVIRKIQTADERFRANGLVTLGIPYDGIHAGKPIYLEMMLQLSLGKNNSVYLVRDKTSQYARVQPYAQEAWDDCMGRTNTYILPNLILKLLRKYMKRTVYVLSKYIDTNNKEKTPEGLKSIELEPGHFNTTIVINDNIRVRVLPALSVPDCRNDLTRKDLPSSSHVVAIPKRIKSVEDILNNNVPKEGDAERIVWKYSFFVAEKNKMRTVVEGCRIKLLRILTEIRDSDPQLTGLSSEHLKTIFFQEVDRVQGRRDWNESKLSQRFLGIVRKVSLSLSDMNCLSYFIQPPDFPSLNLFDEFDGKQLKEMQNVFDEILTDPIANLKLSE